MREFSNKLHFLPHWFPVQTSEPIIQMSQCCCYCWCAVSYSRKSNSSTCSLPFFILIDQSFYRIDIDGLDFIWAASVFHAAIAFTVKIAAILILAGARMCECVVCICICEKGEVYVSFIRSRRPSSHSFFAAFGRCHSAFFLHLNGGL